MTRNPNCVNSYRNVCLDIAIWHVTFFTKTFIRWFPSADHTVAKFFSLWWCGEWVHYNRRSLGISLYAWRKCTKHISFIIMQLLHVVKCVAHDHSLSDVALRIDASWWPFVTSHPFLVLHCWYEKCIAFCIAWHSFGVNWKKIACLPE